MLKFNLYSSYCWRFKICEFKGHTVDSENHLSVQVLFDSELHVMKTSHGIYQGLQVEGFNPYLHIRVVKSLIQKTNPMEFCSTLEQTTVVAITTGTRCISFESTLVMVRFWHLWWKCEWWVWLDSGVPFGVFSTELCTCQRRGSRSSRRSCRRWIVSAWYWSSGTGI